MDIILVNDYFLFIPKNAKVTKKIEAKFKSTMHGFQKLLPNQLYRQVQNFQGKLIKKNNVNGFGKN